MRVLLQHARTPTNNFLHCLYFVKLFFYKKCLHATDLHISRNLFYMFVRITDCEFIASFVVIIFEITKTLIQYPILFGRQVIKADTDITISTIRFSSKKKFACNTEN